MVLGVDSYTDPEIAVQSSNISNVPVPISQQYSLWRILARGPVDPQVLNTYSPTSQPQPAVSDPLTGFTKPAATVPVNHRCVIWTAPYAGDLPLNTVGSIADGATQNELRAFVLGGTSGNVTFSGGGRLCVSGANVAATVSGAGVVPAANTQGSFISDVLKRLLRAGRGQWRQHRRQPEPHRQYFQPTGPHLRRLVLQPEYRGGHRPVFLDTGQFCRCGDLRRAEFCSDAAR